ncbi:MAG: nicotinamide-nucleotide amidohydrolase family protein [Actinobacteria bacterium]|nr:nicotinamide-nucleotide amidohydrolase family protein [Actinomycetota bacterium]MCG2795147.1 nicotinamide-nucleotide amidohydrolase family protein [Actinomycetes bacterium]
MTDNSARIAVLTVGDELLAGEVADLNLRTIGSALSAIGMNVWEHATVRDDIEAISGALRGLLEDSDAVIITGGLGPTSDDVTREAVAHATGRELERRESLELIIRGFFESMGMEMPEENLKQALIPRGAREIGPAGGTAPGFIVEREEKLVIALPGLPREMECMLSSDVTGLLGSRFKSGEVTVTLRINTFGAGESDVAERLGEFIGKGPVRYGFLALVPRSINTVSYRERRGAAHARRATEAYSCSTSRERNAAGADASTFECKRIYGTGYLGGPIVVKLTAVAKSRDEADGLVMEEREKVARRLGPLVYSFGDEAMEAVMGRLLRERGLTLAVAESLTAGMVCSRIANVPGSSDFFRGGAVTYSKESKMEILGLPGELLREGTVNRRVALAMAESVRRRFSTDLGVATTGLAGPGDEVEKKPVGTLCLALADGKDAGSWERRLPGDRGLVRSIAAMAAMNVVRLYLLYGADK